MKERLRELLAKWRERAEFIDPGIIAVADEERRIDESVAYWLGVMADEVETILND